MKSEPKCPYCGAIMSFEADSCHVWMKCPFCLSNSQKAEKPDVQNGDFSAIGWAVYWAKCEEIAKEAAMRRPLQEPLAKEDLLHMIGPGDEIVTYCEAKGADRTYANIWTGDLVIDVVGYEHKNHVCFENYGKTWRAWATRPTEEERAAAPWEE